VGRKPHLPEEELVQAVLVLPLEAKVEKAFRRVLATLGGPWRPARRGRPPLRTSKDYALALFVRAFYGWSYREAQAVLRVPRSCLNWAFKRLRVAWVRALIARTAQRLRKQFAVTCGILDSTGVSLSSSGAKRLFYRPYWKLHALVEYAPWAHRVWFAAAKPTRGNVADVVVGKQLLDGAPPSTLYADRGYDAESLYRIAYACGWRINMQQRKCAARRTGIRGRVWRSYDEVKRKKYRGRVEAAFGGFANRYASRIKERLACTRRRACLMWAVAHNIRTLAKASSALIYWTVSDSGRQAQA